MNLGILSKIPVWERRGVHRRGESVAWFFVGAARSVPRRCADTSQPNPKGCLHGRQSTHRALHYLHHSRWRGGTLLERRDLYGYECVGAYVCRGLSWTC